MEKNPERKKIIQEKEQSQEENNFLGTLYSLEDKIQATKKAIARMMASGLFFVTQQANAEPEHKIERGTELYSITERLGIRQSLNKYCQGIRLEKKGSHYLLVILQAHQTKLTQRLSGEDVIIKSQQAIEGLLRALKADAKIPNIAIFREACVVGTGCNPPIDHNFHPSSHDYYSDYEGGAKILARLGEAHLLPSEDKRLTDNARILQQAELTQLINISDIAKKYGQKDGTAHLEFFSEPDRNAFLNGIKYSEKIKKLNNENNKERMKFVIQTIETTNTHQPFDVLTMGLAHMNDFKDQETSLGIITCNTVDMQAYNRGYNNSSMVTHYYETTPNKPSLDNKK